MFGNKPKAANARELFDDSGSQAGGLLWMDVVVINHSSSQKITHHKTLSAGGISTKNESKR